MFLKEIYNYIRFTCSNIHSSILGIYNLTKKKEVNLVKEKKQKRKVPPNISRWVALQALSFVHSATSRFLFLLSLCNNKPLHSLLFRDHNHSSKIQTNPKQNKTKPNQNKNATNMLCSSSHHSFLPQYTTPIHSLFFNSHLPFSLRQTPLSSLSFLALKTHTFHLRT